LAKAIPPASEPIQFDLVARCIRKGLFVTFNEQGKGQHVTIDSLVTNSLAGLTLFVREEAAATLIWAGKASTWSGRTPLTGSSRAARAAITQESGVVLAMIET
jgi:hypothetical protein